MPSQRVAPAGNDARATFEASIVLDVNQSVFTKRIDARRANERAEFDLALRLADLMIDRDVALCINLVRIDAEFGFDVDWHSHL